MQIWQLWNRKLKLEMHYWKQEKYDIPISNLKTMLETFQTLEW
jgi:hypothetical protein